MPKNILMVTDIIDNCSQCKYHIIEQLYSPDWFDCDLGIFCTKTEDPDAMGHTTANGWTKYRLVASDEYSPRPKADIPDWCPRLHRI